MFGEQGLLHHVVGDEAIVDEGPSEPPQPFHLSQHSSRVVIRGSHCLGTDRLGLPIASGCRLPREPAPGIHCHRRGSSRRGSERERIPLTLSESLMIRRLRGALPFLLPERSDVAERLGGSGYSEERRSRRKRIRQSGLRSLAEIAWRRIRGRWEEMSILRGAKAGAKARGADGLESCPPTSLDDRFLFTPAGAERALPAMDFRRHEAWRRAA